MIDLPSFTDKTLDDKKERKAIKEYLYQLTEQLRYTLNNLGEENFTQEFVNTVLRGENGASAEMQLTLDGFRVAIANAQSNIATLEITADGINTRVTNEVAGLNSTITQTAGGLSVRIGNLDDPDTGRVTTAENDITSLELTTAGLAVATANNKLTFTADGLSIYNGGFSIYNNSNQKVCYIDTNGTLQLNGDITSSGGNIGGWSLSAAGLTGSAGYMRPDGYARFGNLYIHPQGVTFGAQAEIDAVWSLQSDETLTNLAISSNGWITLNGKSVVTSAGVGDRPIEVDAGAAAVSGAINSQTWVSFNKTFNAVPRVVTNAVTGNIAGAITAKIKSVDTTGFYATIGGSNDTFTVHWIAVSA
ncbi:MAG TPA: hypothetical protein DEB31_05490 [Clostridiales bacterium]|nr:hypothetical protein [Clostridiales bacterium]